MGKWEVVFTAQAKKDARKLKQIGIKPSAEKLLELLKEDPFANPPQFYPLLGDISGCYSRRISFQHRLVYQVLEESKIVKILRMWTHYE